jgi:hypothetical protein
LVLSSVVLGWKPGTAGTTGPGRGRGGGADCARGSRRRAGLIKFLGSRRALGPAAGFVGAKTVDLAAGRRQNPPHYRPFVFRSSSIRRVLRAGGPLRPQPPVRHRLRYRNVASRHDRQRKRRSNTRAACMNVWARRGIFRGKPDICAAAFQRVSLWRPACRTVTPFIVWSTKEAVDA